ncbi:MAG: butyrate kinase [Nitrospirota bacterium]
MSGPLILAINPGSTSTKIACYEGETEIFSENIDHPEDVLKTYKTIAAQLPYRLEAIEKFIKDKGIDAKALGAIAARGGLMKPVKAGVYKITNEMVEDLRESKERWGTEHASNLGAMIALMLSKKYGVPAFTADPVTVDELEDVARVSGVPEIKRISHLHALNIRAMMKRAAAELMLPVGQWNFVVAHLGSGTSVAAIRAGKIIDVNNALLGMGPFSPLRAGALPTGDLLGLAYSGAYTKEQLERKLVYRSGLMGYTGTNDAREVERRIFQGDREAGLIYDAMAYQLSKEIAAMAAVLKGDVRAVVLTGGVANSRKFVAKVEERVGFIARVMAYPGEAEMSSLAAYARGALEGTETVLEYGD